MESLAYVSAAGSWIPGLALLARNDGRHIRPFPTEQGFSYTGSELTPYFSPLLHLLFEALAYFVGFRYFLTLRAKSINSLNDHLGGLWVAVGAILGAALGSKVVYWLQYPTYVLSNFPDPVALMGGKTIVGGFLGGLIGVEYAKKRICLSSSTGDLFVFPLILSTMIGRVGCFFAGLEDHTYGSPTSLLWGVDFGDGVFRHPTQLYEIVFLSTLWLALRYLRSQLRHSQKSAEVQARPNARRLSVSREGVPNGSQGREQKR